MGDAQAPEMPVNPPDGTSMELRTTEDPVLFCIVMNAVTELPTGTRTKFTRAGAALTPDLAAEDTPAMASNDTAMRADKSKKRRMADLTSMWDRAEPVLLVAPRRA
jgi:hypothetical protein